MRVPWNNPVRLVWAAAVLLVMALPLPAAQPLTGSEEVPALLSLSPSDSPGAGTEENLWTQSLAFRFPDPASYLLGRPTDPVSPTGLDLASAVAPAATPIDESGVALSARLGRAFQVTPFSAGDAPSMGTGSASAPQPRKR